MKSRRHTLLSGFHTRATAIVEAVACRYDTDNFESLDAALNDASDLTDGLALMTDAFADCVARLDRDAEAIREDWLDSTVGDLACADRCKLAARALERLRAEMQEEVSGQIRLEILAGQVSYRPQTIAGHVIAAELAEAA